MNQSIHETGFVERITAQFVFQDSFDISMRMKHANDFNAICPRKIENDTSFEAFNAPET